MMYAQPNKKRNINQMDQPALVPAVQQAALEATATSKSMEGEILSNYFIETCRTVVPVLGILQNKRKTLCCR